MKLYPVDEMGRDDVVQGCVWFGGRGGPGSMRSRSGLSRLCSSSSLQELEQSSGHGVLELAAGHRRRRSTLGTEEAVAGGPSRPDPGRAADGGALWAPWGVPVLPVRDRERDERRKEQRAGGRRKRWREAGGSSRELGHEAVGELEQGAQMRGDAGIWRRRRRVQGTEGDLDREDPEVGGDSGGGVLRDGMDGTMARVGFHLL